MKDSTPNSVTGPEGTTPHPLAVRAFDKLRHLTERDREFVVRELMRAFGNPDSHRAAICIDAIAACKSSLDRVPSAGAYANWRANEHSADPSKHWPSKSFITETFDNSWSEAIAHLTGKFKPNVGWQARAMKRNPITREETIDAIAEWLLTLTADIAARGYVLNAPGWIRNTDNAGLRVPPAHIYGLWARQQALTNPRIPTSLGTIYLRCGGWRSAVSEANQLGQHSPLIKYLVGLALLDDASIVKLGLPLVCEAALEYGPNLKQNQFDEYHRNRAFELPDNETRWLRLAFSAHRLTSSYYSWGALVVEAIRDYIPSASRSCFRIDDRAITWALRTCADDLGFIPTGSQYTDWRNEQSGRFPTFTTIRRRFETWDRAIAQTFETTSKDQHLPSATGGPS